MKKIKMSLLAVIASLLFVGCGNNTKPSDVALKVFDALKELDFKTVKQYIAKDFIESVDQIEKHMIEDVAAANNFKNDVKGTTCKILSENISEDGNSAVVETEVTFRDGKKHQNKMDMVKVDGEWKINENPF